MEHLLKENNLKITGIRMIILEELCNSNSSINTEELYNLVVKRQKTNISTVYRNLKILTKTNLVLKVTEINGEIYYRFNNREHRHHMICINCNEVIPIDICPLEKLENSLSEKTGYKILSHSLEFRGLCPKCKKKAHLN